jgi:16S rRNA (guanine1516-N2)-methyltransferase
VRLVSYKFIPLGVEINQIVNQTQKTMTKDSSSPLYNLERSKEGVLELKKGSSKEKISVDFLSGEFQQRLKTLSKSQPLFKAMALEKGEKIIDATAGLGKDALSFCYFGVSVTAIEENPTVFALLEDGLERAFLNPHFKKKFEGKIKLVCGSSIDYLKNLEEKPDTIYLDPMYPHEEKSAKPKKEMAFLRDLVSETKNVEGLLNICLKSATKRVVLKRPVDSEVIGKPSHSFESKLVRFDMYIMNQRIK